MISIFWTLKDRVTDTALAAKESASSTHTTHSARGASTVTAATRAATGNQTQTGTDGESERASEREREREREREISLSLTCHTAKSCYSGKMGSPCTSFTVEIAGIPDKSNSHYLGS